jgi:predicted lipoprotein with Yx(FWY)xxD motif
MVEWPVQNDDVHSAFRQQQQPLYVFVSIKVAGNKTANGTAEENLIDPLNLVRR